MTLRCSAVAYALLGEPLTTQRTHAHVKTLTPLPQRMTPRKNINAICLTKLGICSFIVPHVTLLTSTLLAVVATLADIEPGSSHRFYQRRGDEHVNWT